MFGYPIHCSQFCFIVAQLSAGQSSGKIRGKSAKNNNNHFNFQ